ncbi:MAG: helix-turn-helix domain-containing protein, partial [Mesorhizobium sp.]
MGYGRIANRRNWGNSPVRGRGRHLVSGWNEVGSVSHGLPRFSIIPADAVTDPRLEGRDLQILALFGRHTDRRGWCCRSQVKMARELNCGRATIQRSIARLVDAGYLEHRVKYRESGGDTAHEYRVVLDVPDDRYGAEIPHDVDDDDGGEISHRRES